MWSCVWAEDEAWNLGKEAQTKGYHISWTEVRLASPSIPQTLHNQCSFPANSLWSRMISMLKNSAFSSLLKTYLTQEEAEQSGPNEDAVWEFTQPWTGRFTLAPFKKEHFSHGWVKPHRYSL